MNKAKKYLKDGVDIQEFADKLTDYYKNHISEDDELIIRLFDGTIEFLHMQEKPTLTEDERVILRNVDLQNFNKIGRDKYGKLYLLRWHLLWF